LGLALGQIKFLRIEERAVLYMQWQLKKPPRAQWTENLCRAMTIADRVVVTGCGVVGVACLLQHSGRICVAEQPVHPDAAAGLAADCRNPFPFESPPDRVVPGVEPMNANLATGLSECQDRSSYIGGVICRRPPGGVCARDSFASTPFERNEVVS